MTLMDIVVITVVVICLVGLMAIVLHLLRDLLLDAIKRRSDPAAFPKANQTGIVIATNPRGQNQSAPVTREVQKEVVPAGKAFGKMEYEEIQLKFLDNFLLKYFHSIIMVPGPIFATGPWKEFCEVNEWAKGMPELFWLMTGYRPDEYQLNSAISEYCRRIALSKAVNK